MAISSPLLETTINGARGVLLNITAGPDITLEEMWQAADVISRATDHEDAHIIMGAVIDPLMGQEVRVTVLATGFGPDGDRYKQAAESDRGGCPAAAAAKARVGVSPAPLRSRLPTWTCPRSSCRRTGSSRRAAVDRYRVPAHACAGTRYLLPYNMSYPLLQTVKKLLADERGTIYKPHGDHLKFALAFPNSYRLGMSNLGYQLVYRLFNEREDTVCERAFLPEPLDEIEYRTLPHAALLLGEPARDQRVRCRRLLRLLRAGLPERPEDAGAGGAAAAGGGAGRALPAGDHGRARRRG